MAFLAFLAFVAFVASVMAADSNIQEITGFDDFNAKLDSFERMLVVEFGGEYCQPCQELKEE